VPIRHVILDRDGVLNREPPGGGWITGPEDWSWEPGALDGLRRLAEAGILITVATNQSAVGRGVMDMDAVDRVNDVMLSEAETAGAPIDGVFVCPHAPDEGCPCRKPAPGLIEEAVLFSGMPPAETVAVGDALRDIEAARAAGVRAVLVRTGKGWDTELRLGDANVAVYDDLRCAAEAIVAEE
jgi:D-glycero-D-manno-heptose 1,7-bisphosphate phosphatase